MNIVFATNNKNKLKEICNLIELEQKNRISHRAVAVRKLAEYLLSLKK